MDTNKEILFKELSYRIVGLAMDVHNELGYGFLEKVYENALLILLNEKGINAKQQKSVAVYFHGKEVGKYTTDIVVEDKIILELKSTESIADAHRAQALNYLKATGMRLAIIINFGKKRLEYERLVL